MSCAGHVDGMKKIDNNSLRTCQNQVKLFLRGNERPFATVDVKNLIFWDVYSVPELFNCKHKPFIFRVLVNANRLLTHAGHSHGWLE